MFSCRTVALLSFASLFTAFSGHSQTPVATTASPSLTIVVPEKPALVLTAEEFDKMPQHTAKMKEHDAEAVFKGVPLHHLLVRAGAPTGNRLHGRALAGYVLASAHDGYQAVFTLTEMDPDFTDDEVLVADRMNGSPLPEKQGPFRIIVVHDKKPARSVRMLEKLEVVELRR